MASVKTSIFLTRHGQTEWNLARRAQGHLDSPLTELGRTQAVKLGQRLATIPIDIAYCSSCGRTLATAQLALADRPIKIVPRDDLRELYFGSWEGKSWREIEAQYTQQHDNLWRDPAAYQPVDGEEISAFVARIKSAVSEIAERHGGQNIFVVAHGGVVKALMYAYYHGRLKEFWTHPPYAHSASLAQLIYCDGQFSFEMLPDISHL